MAIVAIVSVVAVVFIIAAVVIGREARRLDAHASVAIADADEATHHVADHVPFEVSARLSYEDVGTLLDWHLELLRRHGLSDADVDADGPDGPLVADDPRTPAELVRRAEAAGLDVTPTDVAAVVSAHLDYLRQIGAFGEEGTSET